MFFVAILANCGGTQDSWQSKMLSLSANGDHKGQLKTLFLAILIRLSSVGENTRYCQNGTKLLIG